MLAVRFIADGDLLQKVELTLARKFSYLFEGTSRELRRELSAWIESYLARKPQAISLSLSKEPFQQKVMDGLLSVPFGSTLSYSELATNIGSPKAARAVGNACGKNPFPLLIPCHRVIQKNGKVGGFSLNLEIKKQLLLFEGEDNRIF